MQMPVNVVIIVLRCVIVRCFYGKWRPAKFAEVVDGLWVTGCPSQLVSTGDLKSRTPFFGQTRFPSAQLLVVATSCNLLKSGVFLFAHSSDA